MLVHNLFPTPVAKFFIGREFTAEELSFVEQQPTHNNMGNTTSDDRYVLTHKTMSDIYTFTEKCVNEYLTNIHAPRNKVSLRVTQSWFNYSKPGEWHHKHTHANSFVSGVLYMKAVKDTDKITFHKEDHKWIEFPTDKFNEYNSSSWWLPVETGQLMLFPSSLAHSVPQVEANETRISLAFNTFPVGYVGQEETLTALHLGSDNPKVLV